MPARRDVSCASTTAQTRLSTPPTRTSAAAINEFTAGKGADVIIDMVGGDLFDECRTAIASQGRMVIVGFTSNRIPEIQVNRLLLRNFAIVGLNAFHYKHEMTAPVHQCRRPLRVAATSHPPSMAPTRSTTPHASSHAWPTASFTARQWSQ